jgi:hypothetical protein
MKLVCCESEKLPRLAWCAQIRKASREITVNHGSLVETGPDYFFEGAWNGAFGNKDFGDATICTGSGGRLVSTGILFSSPTDTLERLHVLRTKDAVLVSNSMAFLLAREGDSVDLEYPFYEPDLSSIVRGFRNYTKTIPTQRGGRIRLYYYCNLLINEKLVLQKRPKNIPPPFADYAHYVGFLQQELDTLFRNAKSPNRKAGYEPLTTISTGYDSPACSVLANRAGCSEAITFWNARQQFAERNDSGRRVAEHLGLHVTEFDSTDYLRMGGFPEAEFLAYGTGGEDVVMAAASHSMRARVLVTGSIGGTVWDSNHGYNAPDIIRSDPSGASMAEYRLRLGFIHVPLPFFGCLQKASIYRISHSPEMQPWSIRPRYNRPIPRRIVEEAGVPREWFGQIKKAITQPIHQPLETTMSPESYADFMSFAKNLSFFRRGYYGFGFTLMRLAYRVNLRIMQIAQWRMKPRWWLLYPVVPERYRDKPSLNLFTFHWGIIKTMARYSKENL